MEININLKGVAKLVEACSRALGGLGEPTAIVRKAKAEAEKRAIENQADQQEAIKKAETDAMVVLRKREILDNFPVLAEISPEYRELAKRGMNRVLVQEARRQQNMEAITAQAALALPDDSQVNDKPVEEDWINDFFENCKDIGDVEMQTVWGKILAGEVAEPGTYSRRTIATLRLMNKKDVSMFEKFWAYVWGMEGGLGMAFDKRVTKQNFLSDGISPWWRMHLEGIGLIKNRLVLRLEPAHSRKFYYGNDVYQVTNQKDDTVKLTGSAFTFVGNELSHISTVDIDSAYRDDVLTRLSELGLSVTHIKGPNPPA